jgi:cytochrome bd-type quinol oxidase subunit 1
MLCLTTLELAQIQLGFTGFTIVYHIVFPIITIGLASCRTALEAC